MSNYTLNAERFGAVYPVRGVRGPRKLRAITDAYSLTGITVGLTSSGAAATFDNYAELPTALVDTTLPSEGTQRLVGPARTYTTLQAAWNAASLGDVIIIDDGITIGSLVLSDKGAGTSWITIRPQTVPTAGVRVTPSTGFPKLTFLTSDGDGVIRCATGAHHVRIIGLEIVPIDRGSEHYTVVNLTDPAGSPTLASMPHHIVLDRCYIHQGSVADLRRCVSLNSATSAVIDSYIVCSDSSSSDANAVWCYTSTGPLKIHNNYLAGPGENFMCGGADPSIVGLVPSDITFTKNYVHKPLAWQGSIISKNNFELKNAQRVLVEGNVFDGSWPGGQNGTLILFQSVNQSGTAPQSGVRDVTVRHNFGRNAQHLFGLARYQDNPDAYYQARVSIHDNVVVNIADTDYDGDDSAARMFLIGALSQLTIKHNTLLGAAGGPTVGSVYFGITVPCVDTDILDNIIANGNYGFHGEGVGSMSATVAYFLTDNGGSLENNVFIETGSATGYPASNQHPATMAAVGFTTAGITSTWETADPDTVCAALVLASGSAYRNDASDGTDPGADIAAVRSAIAGVWS